MVVAFPGRTSPGESGAGIHTAGAGRLRSIFRAEVIPARALQGLPASGDGSDELASACAGTAPTDLGPGSHVVSLYSVRSARRRTRGGSNAAGADHFARATSRSRHGGGALLAFPTGGCGLGGDQLHFSGPGHAHKGFLLVLSLMFVYVNGAELADSTRWTARILLVLDVLARAMGFVLHGAKDGSATPSMGTRVTGPVRG